MFEYKYKFLKEEFDVTFGSICVNNIVFSPEKIEKTLPDIVLNDNNLKYMFAESELDDNKRKRIYRRFVPKIEAKKDLYDFVNDSIKNNKTFYSFLSEGILGLVFRDLYKFELAQGVIDIGETLTDSHTGVDACMYNIDESAIILGEAKFYEDRDQGINQIIEDLTKKNITNKLESLQTKVENCDTSNKIILKNLVLDKYDELTVEQFLQQKIYFVGFVLHSETDISKYCNKDFYDTYDISTNKLKSNICKSINIETIDAEYEIILVHLPIKDKKSLIVKMIESSKEKIKSLTV